MKSYSFAGVLVLGLCLSFAQNSEAQITSSRPPSSSSYSSWSSKSSSYSSSSSKSSLSSRLSSSSSSSSSSSGSSSNPGGWIKIPDGSGGTLVVPPPNACGLPDAPPTKESSMVVDYCKRYADCIAWLFQQGLKGVKGTPAALNPIQANTIYYQCIQGYLAR